MFNRNSIIGALISVCCLTLLAGCQPAATDLSELSKPERHLFEQAAKKRAEGDIDKAVALYTQAAKISTGAVEAHLAIAEILRADNNAAQSLDMIHDALRLQPEDARLHMERGFSLIAKADYNKATQSFDKAIGLDKELGSAYSGKAVAYDLEGKHTEAQAVYSEAKARGLSSPAMDNNYALSLIFTGKYDEAVAMLAPHADAHYATKTMQQNLALAYGLKGDVGRAAEYGGEGLDPLSAKKNMEFYKRFTALKYGNQSAKKMLAIAPASGVNGTNQAVPVAPVISGDVGFVTGTGKSDQIILKPSVEVIEMDADAFDAMVE